MSNRISSFLNIFKYSCSSLIGNFFHDFFWCTWWHLSWVNKENNYSIFNSPSLMQLWKKKIANASSQCGISFPIKLMCYAETSSPTIFILFSEAITARSETNTNVLAQTLSILHTEAAGNTFWVMVSSFTMKISARN